jgi:hypothetical protein
MWIRVLSVACVLGLVACGSDSDDDGGGSGGSGSGGSGSGGSSGSGGGDGSTTCGVQNCAAGQHCQTLVCVNGCLTDDNCASNQTCADIDDMTHIGTCRNQAAAKDCDAFCEKSEACGDPDTAQCQQQCEGFSAECVSCVNDSNCGQGCEAACML